ncbi:hypothetical protein NA56DRAFT_751033 [Hyaloscypha hepaticicola]|uniref:Uncharacterized protein n=1 Tax=Hyaloscypha hepaticicola TaxID=2082293 RepID=A0A2J6PXE4_9HELO|nr:hypothetical protein NA56DRAFT_751033 [Hyaloscypha hepaticicola]
MALDLRNSLLRKQANTDCHRLVIPPQFLEIQLIIETYGSVNKAPSMCKKIASSSNLLGTCQVHEKSPARQKAASSVTSQPRHLPMIAEIAVGSNNRKYVRPATKSYCAGRPCYVTEGARIAHSKRPKKGNAIADRDLIDGYGDSGSCLESRC